MRRVPVMLAMLALPWCVQAQDPALLRIREALLPLRVKQEPNLKTRGARPVFTPIKRQLRDWIESRLQGFSRGDDEGEFVRKLNRDLRQMKLFCGAKTDPLEQQCPDNGFWSNVGFLGEIRLNRPHSGPFLVVVTGLGIVCGYDESAYIFEFRQNRWERRWQSEQNNYSDEQPLAQTITSVLVSENRPDDPSRIVVTLGFRSWCSSNWHTVYYRAWRMSPENPVPVQVFDESEFSFGPWDAKGSVGPSEVLVQYAVASIDSRVFVRPAIRHYAVAQDNTANRVDPVALSPRDFAEEWLQRPWAESQSWSDPPMREVLGEVHRTRIVHPLHLGPVRRADTALPRQPGSLPSGY